MIEYSDADIVGLVLSGDEIAFDQLVQKYRKKLLDFTFRYVKDYIAAEDIVQEALFKVYRKMDTFQQKSSLKSWIYTIAANTAKNHLRKRKYFADINDVDPAMQPVSESNAIHKQHKELLKQLVETLPPKQKQAVRLRMYSDLSFQEVADVMDCPYDTAKANYRHAITKIRDSMESLWRRESLFNEEVNVVDQYEHAS